MVPVTKRKATNLQLAFHSEELIHDINAGNVRKKNNFNSDETHFAIYFHNRPTIARQGKRKMKYAEVVSKDNYLIVVVALGTGNEGRMYIPTMNLKKFQGFFQTVS